MKIQKYEPQKTRSIILANRESFDITDEEFEKIDKFIQLRKTGLVRLKNGEYINLSYVSAIKNKIKDNEKLKL